jgi:tRNA-specific 2-thiouridylase
MRILPWQYPFLGGNTMKKKVVIAMSGGVDSSLSAALLVQQGYDVIGLTMRLSDEGNLFYEEQGCCNESAVEDARRVAEIVGIPYYVVNFKAQFKEKVIDYFIDEYAHGRTPNPCIACNRHIKFDALMRRAAELGADFVATGHYAQVIHTEGGALLKKGVDTAKDQSYVLYNISREGLNRFLMPLGAMRKEETRALSEKLNLPTAHKKESQEICFIPNDDYHAYLKKAIPDKIKAGDIVDKTGKKLGRHNGLPFFTIGQRRGLGIAYPEPLYVTRLDVKNNRVIVGTSGDLFKKKLTVQDINWLKDFDAPFTANVKIRYGSRESTATVYPDKTRARVIFDEPQRAITAGQAAVFYDKEGFVLGGGTIIK